MTSQTYVFDHASGREGARLRTLEEFLDPGTIHVLETVGVTGGWTCLEIGAGGGSIALWLSRSVGSSGKVIATELDTRFLAEAGAQPNVEVRRHDIVADTLPDHEFDLVHARLVLEHIPQRDAVLPKLVRTLRPGGWLVVEAVDYASAVPVTKYGAAEHAHSQSIRLREFEAAGHRLDYGRHMPRLMREAGLVTVGHEGRVFVMEGGSSGARWFRLSMQQLRSRLVGPDKLSDADIDRMLNLFDDPAWAAFSPIIYACWGRSPLP